MLTTRLIRLPVATLLVSRNALSSKHVGNVLRVHCKKYAQDTRTRMGHAARRKSLREIAMAPAGPGAFTVGKAILAGASGIGLGALCYYGLGMSSEVGALDRSVLWPQIVRDRIRDTYLYFGGSIAVTAASALAVARTPALMNIMMRSGFLAIAGTFAVMIGSGILVRSIPYQEGFGLKQLAWMGHSAVMGAVVAPLALMGGPLLIRAAWYTAGVIGGLSTVAACAPSEKFLNMGGPLAIGLGAVLVASIGGMFLPPTTALGAGLYSISIYGGLVLFSFFLLYDTQKIVRVAETHPTNSVRPYDPVNMSIGIYLDTLNIFIRIAMILAGGGGRRK